MFSNAGRRTPLPRRLAASFFCLVLSALTANQASASMPPGVTFVGTQSQIGSGWYGPVGVAADSKGNLFVASYRGSYISEVNLATGATSTVTDFVVRNPQDMKILGDTIYIASQNENLIKAYSLTTHALLNTWSVPSVFAIAIDSAGNIYGGVDGAGAKIVKFAAGSSTSTTVVSSGLSSMTALAFDAAGQLYASDTTVNKIYKYDPSNGYARTTVPINVTSPRDLIFDSQGRLYVAEGGDNTGSNPTGKVHRYPAGAFNDASGTVLAQGLNYEEEIAIASTGDTYVTSYLGDLVTKISSQVNFGQTVPVASSATQTLVFSVNANTTIHSVNAGGTNGSAADFRTSNDTCVVGSVYTSNQLCTIDLTFAPYQPAPAYGSIVIGDASGNPLTTVYASGIGVSSQLAFHADPLVDSLQIGSLYGIAPVSNNKAAVTNGSSLYVGNLSTAPTLVASGLSGAKQIAADAQNNVFIADTGNNRVVTVPALGGAATPTLFSTSSSSFTGVAVDGSGSVYYADATNGQIIRRDWADTAYGSEIVAATGLTTPGAIAVDNARNLYVLSGNNVLELPLQNGVYGSPVTITSSLSSPTSIALDGNSNLYISDNGNKRFVEIPFVGTSYGSQITLFDGANDLQQALVEPNGLVYIANGDDGNVVYIDRSTPPSLDFDQTTLHTTSTSGPQSIAVQNIGNASVSFAPAVNGNPVSSSSSFVLNSSATTCPVATTVATTLANGNSCVVAVDYTPQSLSDTSATLTFTDNVLNAPGSTQVASMSGSVVPPTPTVTGISPDSGYVNGGSTVTITGTFFTGATSVKFGSTSAVFTVVSDTSITATVPVSTSVQTVDITVTTANGTSAAVVGDQFRYVAIAPQLAFAAIPAHTYGDAPFAVSAASASSGAVTYTVLSGPATVAGNAVTVTGSGVVQLQASQAAAGIYTTATTTTSFAVNPQAVRLTLTDNVATPIPGQSVIFTAKVTGLSGGIPTGTVTFMDGNTVLATVTLSNGVATYTTAALLSGSHSISVIYSGDANYSATGSAGSGGITVPVAPLDFTFAATGTAYQTVIPGKATSFNFALAPSYGVYPADVAFAVTGLPAGASYTMTPSALTASSGATTAVLTVQTANVSAKNQSGVTARGAAPLALAFLILPFASLRRLRKNGALGRLAMMAILAGATLIGMAGLTGCGSGNGFLGQSPQDYTVTITATSGTVQHSTTVTLNLQ